MKPWSWTLEILRGAHFGAITTETVYLVNELEIATLQSSIEANKCAQGSVFFDLIMPLAYVCNKCECW